MTSRERMLVAMTGGQPVTVEEDGRLSLSFQPYESRVLWLQE